MATKNNITEKSIQEYVKEAQRLKTEYNITLGRIEAKEDDLAALQKELKGIRKRFAELEDKTFKGIRLPRPF